MSEAVGGASGAAGLMRLVDDRGRALESQVEVCFVYELSTECVDLPARQSDLELRPFDLLRVEGPDHGPVTVRAHDLTRGRQGGEDGPPRLVIPRKMLLRVLDAPKRGLVAALYAPDGDFARPVHQFDLTRGEPATGGGETRARAEVKVPAGEWVLALEARGNAPQLHSLVGEQAAEPGGETTLAYRPRGGWSLVLRAVSWEDETPIPGAEARVVPVVVEAPETSEPSETGAEDQAGERTEATAIRGTTSSAGLALVSGIERPLANVVISHPELIDGSVPAVGGDPGEIVARDVTLEPGGAVEVAIRVDGEPAAGWMCHLLDRTRGVPGPDGRAIRIASADSDAEGLCRIERAPAGSHWLRAEPPETVESSAVVEEELIVANGEATQLDLDLYPIVIEGDVLRGTDPVPGYRVNAYWIGDRSSSALDEPLTVAETDEDGAYELSVWKPGTYFFTVGSPDGPGRWTGESRYEEVLGPSARIDFHLSAAELEGIVVDLEGRPVPGVSVSVRIKSLGTQGVSGSLSMIRSGEDGRFSVTLKEAALEVELSVLSPRYSSQGPEVVRVEPGQAPPPVILAVAERALSAGRLVGASGAPVAGAWIGLYRSQAGAPSQRLSNARTEADGSFQMPDPGAAPYTLYATGPGCPLTVQSLPAIPAEGWTVSCAAGGGSIAVRLTTEDGEPAAGIPLMLRLGEAAIPFDVIVAHLGTLGLAFQTDASGRMVIPELPAGASEIFALSQDGSGSVLEGQLVQLLGSVAVTAGGVAQLETTIPGAP